MIPGLLFPLIFIGLVLLMVSLGRGKDYKLVVRLPPADTTRGKLTRVVLNRSQKNR